MAKALLQLAVLAFLVHPTYGQSRRPTTRPFPSAAPEFGLRTGYDTQLQVASAGGQLRLPVTVFLEILTSADYYFVNGQRLWQANADTGFRMLPTEVIYGGIGLSLSRRIFGETPGTDPAIKPGVNLLGGIAAPRRLPTTLRPYAEARWTFIGDDYDEFSLVGGLNVRLGSR